MNGDWTEVRHPRRRRRHSHRDYWSRSPSPYPVRRRSPDWAPRPRSPWRPFRPDPQPRSYAGWDQDLSRPRRPDPDEWRPTSPRGPYRYPREPRAEHRRQVSPRAPPAPRRRPGPRPTPPVRDPPGWSHWDRRPYEGDRGHYRRELDGQRARASPPRPRGDYFRPNPNPNPSNRIAPFLSLTMNYLP